MSYRQYRALRARTLAAAAALVIGVVAFGTPAAAFAQENDSMAGDAQSASDSELQATDEQNGSDEEGPAEDEGHTTFVANDTGRQISGTIYFSEDTTAEQRGYVTVEVLQQGTYVPERVDATVEYNPTSGAYSVSDLAPGAYLLKVRLNHEASGWSFWPGTVPGGSWAGSIGGDTAELIDFNVEAADAELDLFFDPTLGGLAFVGIGAKFGDSVTFTNVETQQTVQVPYRSGAAGPDGPISRGSATFASGTVLILSSVIGGQTAYLDANGFATPDPTQARQITVGDWSGETITLDFRTLLSGIAPDQTLLTEATRGGIIVPATAQEGENVRISVGTNLVGQAVWGWLFSSPTSLNGAVVDAQGYVTFSLPKGVTKDHRLAITNYSGTVVHGWGNISIAPSGSETASREPVSALAQTGFEIPPVVIGSIAALLMLGGVVGLVATAGRTRQRA